MSFIKQYLLHTSIYESPTSFWKWSAYATIAAVLRDNCYRRTGDSYLYPNIYVLFLAESSGHRKNKPVDLSETMVTKINNTKIISGRSSVQAILDELSRAETDKKTGKITRAGSAIFYAPELAAGIVADPEAIKILTDIYDYKSNPYKSRLRTGPCFNLEKIVFSMLTASNEDMIKSMFDRTAIKGGMLARTFLVAPNEIRPPNSLMRVDFEERKKSLALVTDQLALIAALNGEYVFTEESIHEYESWYNPFRKDYSNKKESSGVVGRIHTSVLKLAMILAANDQNLIVSKQHIEEAITECIGLLPNYSVFTMSNGKSTISEAGAIVIADLLAAKDHKLQTKILLRHHWDAFDSELLSKLIITFEQAGMIQQQLCGSDLYIQLTATALEMLKGGG